MRLFFCVNDLERNKENKAEILGSDIFLLLVPGKNKTIIQNFNKQRVFEMIL